VFIFTVPLSILGTIFKRFSTKVHIHVLGRTRSPKIIGVIYLLHTAGREDHTNLVEIESEKFVMSIMCCNIRKQYNINNYVFETRVGWV
jgi:hypothetical protein